MPIAEIAHMDAFARHRGPFELLALPADRVIEPVRDFAMFRIDRQGRAASWNEGVRQILGWERDDWLGQPLFVGFTPDDVTAGVPERELQKAAASGRADDDRWMQRKNGDRFYAVGAVTRLLDDSGQLVGFLKVLRDFTTGHEAALDRERLLQSERAARAEANRQSAALTAALEAIADGVYFGNADGIERSNAAALTLLGASSVNELQHAGEGPAQRFRLRRERGGPLLQAAELPFVRALQGQAAVLETWATRRTSGEDVFIRTAAAPIVVDGRVVGAVAVNSDLTERVALHEKQLELHQAATLLHERDERLRALVEGVRDYAIFTIDLQGRISSWHAGAQLMKGYSAEEAIGMPFARLFTPEERENGRPQREMDEAARSGEYKGDGLRLRKDGSTFEAAGVLTALHGLHGELLGYLKLTHDITQRKRLDRERENLLRDSQAMHADAERTSHSKSEFLATISHELRTPLSAILGWTHVLQRGLTDADGSRQALAAIGRNARTQVQLMEDLLDMSRIEAGQMRLDMQPVELAGVIVAAVDSVVPAAAAKGIAVRTLLDPAAASVRGDPARLQQIVSNLLGNAIKFTPAGGKVDISLSGAGAASAVEIAVSDTGQGIADSFMPLLFDRFQQQDASATRRHGGLGIGLAIVRQLAELHGGSVRAQSPGIDRGAVFTVTLPSLAAPLPAAAAAAAGAVPGDALPAPAELPLEGLSVLLVEDEPDGREMAAHVLRDAGADVQAAASAQEGFALVMQHRFDAIVSDIGMPVHDGYDFLRWVRALELQNGSGHTAAAAFTAYARPEDRRDALAVGYNMHMVKPMEPGALIAAVANLARGAPKRVHLRQGRA